MYAEPLTFSPRRSRMSRAATAAGVLVVVLGTALTGCGLQPSGGPAAPTASQEPAATVGTERVHEDVAFYPACGNETVEVDGTTWYQLLREEQGQIDRSRYLPDDTGSTASGPGRSPTLGAGGPGMPGTSRVVTPAIAMPAVAEPGEGDDIGTLTVFTDGMGHFVSDSGDLSTWLTTDERTYDWVC